MLDQALTFASVVGLLSDFSSGRSAQSTADVTEFIQWLIEHNHEELAKAIEQNYQTTVSIKALLNNQSSEVNKRLSDLGRSMAFLASKVPDLSGVAASIVPTAELSDQVVNVLCQMKEQGIEWFLAGRFFEGVKLVPDKGKIEISEEQFIQDDLVTMVELGLLRIGYNSKGEEMYYFTRAGAKLVSEQNT